jgi:two-component system sensor histidine kinase YesM
MFSIRYKLSILLLAAIILPILTSILITYNFTKDSVTKDIIQQNSKLLFQGKTNIQNYLKNLDHVTHSALFYGGSDILFNLIKEGEPDYSQILQISSSLEQLGNQRSEFYQALLHLDKSDQTYLLWDDFVKNESGLDISSKTGSRIYIEPTHFSHTYGVNEFRFSRLYEPEQVFSFYRVIEDIPLTTRIGVIIIDVKLDFLKFISNMLYTEDSDEQILILNENNVVIYALDENIIGTPLQEDWMEGLSVQKESDYFKVNNASFNGLVLYDSVMLPYANWKLVKKIPIDLLSQDAKNLTKINTFVLIFFLVLAVGATLAVIYSFINPIKRLIYEMDVIERGNFHVNFPNLKRNDEFGILFRRFHRMVQRLNDLILREYRVEIANKTNQLRALQAQINPHFMNNALQSIGTLALKDNNEKIYSLTSAMGRMMHYNMDIDESIVPLSREIEYVTSYLEVQQERFEDLRVLMNIDESTLDIQIPKMTLQPIVENYFRHGIITQKDIGTISISTKMKNEQYLQIIVEDNGIGMEPNQLLDLTRRLNQKNNYEYKSSEHIGLINVMTRLRLYFNEELQIDIKNIEPHGLKIVLTIPIKRGGEIDYESINRG